MAACVVWVYLTEVCYWLVPCLQ